MDLWQTYYNEQTIVLVIKTLTISLIAIGIIYIIFCLGQQCWKLTKTKWFAPDGIKSWHSVDLVIKGDPLELTQTTFPAKHRKIQTFWALPRMFTSSLMITLLLFLLFYLLSDFPNPTKKIAEAATILLKDKDSTLFYVLGGTASALAFLLQFRANLRSRNRQDWLERVRESLSETINHIPTDEDRNNNFKAFCRPDETKIIGSKSPVDGQSHRIKLELLINPSEKDHRALSTLVRIAYGISDPNELRNWWDPDNNNQADSSYRHVLDVDKNVYKNVDAIRTLVTPETDQKYLITLIIRLSNAILKREWERVKTGV